ncbi:MAG: pentapeptide repeat-containing protein [Gemmataceae bacterium]
MNAVRRSTTLLLLLLAAPSLGFGQERDFQGKEVIKMNFEGKNLTNANFEDAVIKETSFTSAILKKANFRFANMYSGNFRNADLQGADFRDARLENVFITGADFSEANFEGVNLGTIMFFSTKLRNANLRNLKRSNSFDNCDLFGADLRGANLRDMKVYRGSVFRKAKYDSNTIWPTGFDPKEHGAVFVESKDDAPKTKTNAGDIPDPMDRNPTGLEKRPNPAAPDTPAKTVIFQGREDLQGFGELKFVLPGGGKAEMIDASKKAIPGTVQMNGDRVTFTFPDCVYEGTTTGDAIVGKGRFTKGDNAGVTWNFRVVLQGVPNQPDPAVPPVPPAPGAKTVMFQGREDLQGFGDLKFVLPGGGKAEMIDANKKAIPGTVQINGNRVTFTFPDCVYEGVAEGDAIQGKGRFTKGDAAGTTWNFRVVLVGAPNQPANPPVGPKAGRTVLRGEEDLPGFGPLAFDLDGSGKVEMRDASKQISRGEYRIAGNRYAMSFPGCVYEGTANGATVVGNARNDKGEVWNFKVSIEGAQPAVPVVDPAPPAPPITPGPGAKLPLDGLYMKVYQANGSAIIELFYFTPDGKVSTRPFGGLNPFDWAKAAKTFSGYTGTYTIQGGNILMRMGDGKTRKETYGINNEGVQLDGYLAQKMPSFPQGAKLTGRWSGSSSSVGGVDRATSSWSFHFGNDGTYEWERQGAVFAKGPDVTGFGGANARERGTFALSGNTLRLTPSQGQPRSMTIFPYEGYGNEQQFNIEGMFFRQTK